MPKRSLLVVGFFFLALGALGRLTGFFPFTPPHPIWSLDDDYTGRRIPAAGSVTQSRSAPSDIGIMVGVDGPGYVEWSFSRQGHFPTVIQPYFEPVSGRPLKITLRTPSHPRPIVLFENMPVRSRPMDISRIVRGDQSYALRFEGDRAVLVAIRFFEPSEQPRFPWPLAILVLAALGFFIFRRNRSGMAIVMLCALGFYFRWKTFCTYYSLPLDGDSVEYWALGSAMDWKHLLLLGPRREPAFIWAVYTARHLFGESIRSVRFLGVICSVLCIPLTIEAALAMSWPLWVGMGAAALVATNPFAIFMSVQGYQLEFFTLVILLFSIAWLKKEFRLTGWLGGLLCVTRFQSFFAVVPLLAISDWKEKWGRRQRLYAWLPFVLMTIFYFGGVHHRTGSFLSHLTPFGGSIKLGPAGADTSAPLAKLSHFLFAPGEMKHRFAALVNGYLRIVFDPRDPYNRIFLNSHYARSWNLLFLPFFWVGIWACFRNAQDRRFLWLPLLFLSGLPILHDTFTEPRLLFMVQPFMALLTARGVWFIARARRGN